MTLSIWIIALIVGIAIGAVLVMLWSVSIAKRQRNLKQKIIVKAPKKRKIKVMKPTSELPAAKYNPDDNIGLMEFREVIEEEEENDDQDRSNN